jgi:preprotein translocase subunit SecF
MLHIIKPGSRFDIVGKQKGFLALSALLVVAFLALIGGMGPNYGIDFKGGSDIILSFNEPVTSEQVTEAAVKSGFADATTQQFGSSGKQFLVQTSAVSVVDEASIDKVRAEVAKLSPIERDSWSPNQPDRFDLKLEGVTTAAALEGAVKAAGFEDFEVEQTGKPEDNRWAVRFEDLGNKVRKGFEAQMGDKFVRMGDDGEKIYGLDRLETVGARVGNQLREDGLTAVFLALAAILVYIAVRFDIRYAPGAVVAVFHDVVLSMGILTAVQMEINLPILASILTIVGYSLNDTIVVFDRIRENYTAGRGGSNLTEIVNTSINETLNRTIVTSLTTFIAVATIYVLGSGLIQNFAFTLIIGVVVGTYSSVFVASPILLLMDTWLKAREEARALRAKMSGEVVTEDA